MKRVESELITNVEELLEDKKIGFFMGYENGSLPLRTSPCFVKEKEDVQRLVWNCFCTNNLSVYLVSLIPELPAGTKVGILCKGCDSRSLVNLIVEKQLKREDVLIMGISCSGMINIDKLTGNLDGGRILEVEENEEEVILKLDTGEQRFSRKDSLYESCKNCTHPTPSVYDILIRVGEHAPKSVCPDPMIAKFRQKERLERWQIFERELSRCVRCYACRNACPNCYCKECFAEQTKPRWFGLSNELSDVLFYHLVRILHQAGRCVDCGACVRACPEKVDLRLFTRMLVDEVKERFDYEPGLSPNDSHLLGVFSTDDTQEFMVEVD
ncbi:MAG: (Fe-S)-binding protein [candidate division WOR-3 bacterium]|nr:MAG: (Fe-S)-binding protein [candidate division WOR-3 bacterium]